MIKSALLGNVKEEDVDSEIEESDDGSSSEMVVRKKKWNNPFTRPWGSGKNPLFLGMDLLFQEFDKSFLRLLGLQYID